jgi:flagellar motor switch protein FliM
VDIDNAGTQEPRTYDLATQKIERGRFPTLDIINEKFVQSARVSISAFTGKAVEVIYDGHRIEEYQEFIATLTSPSCLNVVTLSPLRGQALLCFSCDLVYIVVDSYFGGPGKTKEDKVDAEFASSEMDVAKELLPKLLDNLKQAWSILMRINPEQSKSISDPKLAEIVKPTEHVIVNKFSVAMGDQTGTIHVVHPSEMLESIKAQLSTGIHSNRDSIDKRWSLTFSREIFNAPLFLDVSIGSLELNLSDLLAMKAGDVLPFEDPNTALVSTVGIPLFNGKFGAHGQHYAITITSKI